MSPSEPGEAKEDEAAAITPTLDLHVNLWRMKNVTKVSMRRKDVTFLDLGLELGGIENTSQLKIYIPAQIDRSDILDLSPTLKNQQTLKAVFNDIVEIASTRDDSFTIRKQGPKANGWARRIWRVRGHDIGLEDVADDRYPGMVLTFKETVFERMRKIPAESGCKNYIRIRILLSKDNQGFCITEMPTPSFGLNPMDSYQETVEFRLNERRSYPEDIEIITNSGQIKLNSINYFLITNTKQEITTQHTQFKRVRQLEMPLWQDYIAGKTNGELAAMDCQEEPNVDTSPDPKVGKFINYSKLNNTALSIYQWKEKVNTESEGGGGNGVEDFSAYATFSSTKSVFWIYLIMAVLIGAISSSLSTFVWPYAEKYLNDSPTEIESVDVNHETQ